MPPRRKKTPEEIQQKLNVELQRLAKSHRNKVYTKPEPLPPVEHKKESRQEAWIKAHHKPVKTFAVGEERRVEVNIYNLYDPNSKNIFNLIVPEVFILQRSADDVRWYRKAVGFSAKEGMILSYLIERANSWIAQKEEMTRKLVADYDSTDEDKLNLTRMNPLVNKYFFESYGKAAARERAGSKDEHEISILTKDEREQIIASIRRADGKE